MSFFSKINRNLARVVLEGEEVKNWYPLHEDGSQAISHYTLVVERFDDGGLRTRKLSVGELVDLYMAELLSVDADYYSVKRQVYEATLGSDFISQKKSVRDKVDLKAFRAGLIRRLREEGMSLTRDAVNANMDRIRRDDELYQARQRYGTERSNASQHLVKLPCASTLLDYERKYRRVGSIVCFLRQEKTFGDLVATDSTDAEVRAMEHEAFVVKLLTLYEDGAPCLKSGRLVARPSKAYVVEYTQEKVQKRHDREVAEGHPHPIKVRSLRTYERWIDKYLDPFTVMMKRDGWEAAVKEYSADEALEHAKFPGDRVEFDAWQMHVITIATTREKYMRMTAEEQKKVKRVCRWVIVCIDVAKLCILGYSICRSPNTRSSLEALRMCFADKTYLLRAVGLETQTWDYRCDIRLLAADSGSEFGRDPFGGGQFVNAAKHLGISHLNTVTGVAKLRPHVERFFRTADLKLTQHLPGATGSGPHKLNDRKPHLEACITDDELESLFAAFVAEYHVSPHRMLGGRTPHAVWMDFHD